MADQTPAAEELRALIREAHGLLKDLRTERRAIVELLDDIPTKVDTRIQEHLKVAMEALGNATQQAMEASVAKVQREFDRLEASFTGTGRQARRAGKPSLENIIREHRAAREGDLG